MLLLGHITEDVLSVPHQDTGNIEVILTARGSPGSPKASEASAASPHQDVLSVPKQNTGHIEAIIHKTYEQQPELMGVIRNQATKIIHPSGDEAVQIYKGPGHTSRIYRTGCSQET